MRARHLPFPSRDSSIIMRQRYARGWRRRVLCLALICGLLVVPDAGYAVSAATELAVTVAKDTVTPLPVAINWFKRFFHRSSKPRTQETIADRLIAVSRIQITPQKFVGYQGQTISFSALPLNSNGETIQGIPFDWQSSDTNKAQIDEAGRVRFLQPGLVHISCQAGTAQIAIPILVRPGARPIQSDAEWRLDQQSLTAAGAVIGASSSTDNLFATLLDRLTPTAQAQTGGSGDLAYDELWNDSRNLTGIPRNHASEATRIGPVMPEGSNFCSAAPIYALGGRGIGTALTLYYNSRVWSRRGNTVAFDAITGWPAPGFSLGFGRIVAYNVQGATCQYLLIGPDGTRHYLGSGYYSQTSSYQTNDGSHISFIGNASIGGTLTYTDGTTVLITPVNNRLLPTQILDRNGNYIQIAYKDCTQGYSELALDYITDTLSRKLQFNYDPANRLTSITVPGFGGTSQSPVTQTIVQFDYRTVTTSGTFSGLTVERGTGGSITTLKHIYYPTTGTGYMPSFTVYGVMSSLSARRQMSIGWPNVIQDGVESNNVSFNYPTSGPLTDAPTFTQRTESAANAPTATYSYSTSTNSIAQTKTLTITRPDSSTFNLTRSTNAVSVANGLLIQTEIKNSSGVSLSKLVMNYANDGGGSPQVQSSIAYDDATPTPNQIKVDFDYDSSGNVTNTREYGFQVSGQWMVRRRTHNIYTAIAGAVNLLTETDIYDAQLDANDANDVLIAKATYAYDNYAAMGGLENYGGTAAPPGHYSWYDANDTTRGNVTGRTVWYDIAGNLSYTWLRKIDIFGNVVKEQLSCCNEQTINDTQNNLWALPESVTKGVSGGPQLTTAVQYDFNTSRPTTTVDPQGLTTTLTYDVAGRVSTAPVSDGIGNTLPSPSVSYGDSSLTITRSYTYDDNGTSKTLTSITNLDGWGRVIQTIDPAQSQVNLSYDAMGRVVSRTNPFASGGQPGPATSYTNDALGRTTLVTLPDGQTIQTSYNGNTVTVTDQVNRKMQRITDGLGRLVTVNEQDSSGNLTQATSSTYDYLDNLTQVNQGNQTRSSKYDSMSRLLYERIPEQSATINDGTGTYWTCKYTYTDFGIASHQDARGVITTFSYDSLHRLTQKSYDTSNASGVAATDGVGISYNADGTIDQVNQNNYTETYSYDSFKRVSSVTKFIAGSVYDARKTYAFNYTYNGASQPLTLTYPSTAQVSYSYDSYGRPNSMSEVSGISYNVAGQVSGLTLGNGVVESYGFDSQRLQLTSQTATRNGTTLMSLSYSYQAQAGQMGVNTTAGNAGQLMTVSGSINGSTEMIAYTYDNYGRLVTSNQVSNSTSAQRRFAYDRWGNRTGVWDATSGGNQIQSISYPQTLQGQGSAPTNRIGSVTNNSSTVNYTYDANGNVTNDGAHTYIYDGENRVVSIDGGTAQYRYDPQNHRVCKIVGSSWTHYLWQGDQCLAEHDGTTTYGNYGDPPYGLRSAKVDYLYLGSRKVANYEWSHTPSHTYTPKYLLSDRLSMRLTLDISGNVLGRQGHLPFGEDFAGSGTQQKQHFTGYERDAETGTDYAVNRQYHQAVGRFNRVDPLAGSVGAPQSLNRYAYVRNDPINATDPLGLTDSATYPTIVLPLGCATLYQYEDGTISPLRNLGGSEVLLCSYAIVSLVPIAGGGDGSGDGPAGIKAPLKGKKLKKYNEERAKTENKLKNSQKCRDFLASHGIDPDAALGAVEMQRAYDGENSTIGAYDAGLYNHDEIRWDIPQVAAAATVPLNVLFANSPTMQGVTAAFPGGLPPSQTTAADRSDVYYRGSGISSSNILHEALHSLTGASDAQLASQLGVTLGPNGESQPISDALHDNDCGG